MPTADDSAPANRGTIGFIGLGNQGGPIAHRILDAGLPLVVWARRAEVTESFAAKGAQVAASIHDLAARCDHVSVCVVDDAGVKDVCQALLPAMRRGTRIAIHSTILPETCIALDAQCAARGIGLIDAPVSGGGPGAKAGTLTVMCGGTQALFDSCKPVFGTFGKLIVLLGPVGSGQHAKIINNAMLAANMALAQGALSAGEALGIDRAMLVQLVRGSSGNSYGLDICARFPVVTTFPGAQMLRKDVGLLKTILPEHAGTQILVSAADRYLNDPGSSH